MTLRDHHLIRFGAFAFSAKRALIRAKREINPSRRKGLLLLARADGQTARQHWQHAQNS